MFWSRGRLCMHNNRSRILLRYADSGRWVGVHRQVAARFKDIAHTDLVYAFSADCVFAYDMRRGDLFQMSAATLDMEHVHSLPTAVHACACVHERDLYLHTLSTARMNPLQVSCRPFMYDVQRREFATLGLDLHSTPVLAFSASGRHVVICFFTNQYGSYLTIRHIVRHRLKFSVTVSRCRPVDCQIVFTKFLFGQRYAAVVFSHEMRERILVYDAQRDALQVGRCSLHKSIPVDSGCAVWADRFLVFRTTWFELPPYILKMFGADTHSDSSATCELVNQFDDNYVMPAHQRSAAESVVENISAGFPHVPCAPPARGAPEQRYPQSQVGPLAAQSAEDASAKSCENKAVTTRRKVYYPDINSLRAPAPQFSPLLNIDEHDHSTGNGLAISMSHEFLRTENNRPLSADLSCTQRSSDDEPSTSSGIEIVRMYDSQEAGTRAENAADNCVDDAAVLANKVAHKLRDLRGTLDQMNALVRECDERDVITMAKMFAYETALSRLEKQVELIARRKAAVEAALQDQEERLATCPATSSNALKGMLATLAQKLTSLGS